MDIHFQMGEAMCDLRLLIVHVSALERDWCLCPLPHILHTARYTEYFDGLVQDCSNSSAVAMELLQSCTKPSICSFRLTGMVDLAAIIGTVKLVSRQFTNIYIYVYIYIHIYCTGIVRVHVHGCVETWFECAKTCFAGKQSTEVQCFWNVEKYIPGMVDSSLTPPVCLF